MSVYCCIAFTVYSIRTLAHPTNLESFERNIDDADLFIEETFVDLVSIQSQTATSGSRNRPSSAGQVEVLRRVESILRDGIGGIYDIEYKADMLVATIDGEGAAEGSIGFLSHVDVTADFGLGATGWLVVWCA